MDSNPKKGYLIQTAFLTALNQIKIFHWQTFQYAQHKAFDEFYGSLAGHMDEFIETYMGKYGRVYADGTFSLNLENYQTEGFSTFLDKFGNFLVEDLGTFLDPVMDSDLLNIRDEILGDLNKLRYLLTLV